MKLGQIALINSPGPWYSLRGLIRFFTKKKGVPPFTHSAIGINQVLGEEFVREAVYCITSQPWNNYINDTKVEYEVYEISDLPDGLLEKILIQRYREHAEDIYGYFQLLWWVCRWFFNIFGIKLSNQHNPFPDGTICSEEIWDILSMLNDNEIWYYLKKTGRDNTSPTDLWVLFNKYLPSRFKKVEERHNA
jgi:hypothetical protein